MEIQESIKTFQFLAKMAIPLDKKIQENYPLFHAGRKKNEKSRKLREKVWTFGSY